MLITHCPIPLHLLRLQLGVGWISHPSHPFCDVCCQAYYDVVISLLLTFRSSDYCHVGTTTMLLTIMSHIVVNRLQLQALLAALPLGLDLIIRVHIFCKSLSSDCLADGSMIIFNEMAGGRAALIVLLTWYCICFSCGAPWWLALG